MSTLQLYWASTLDHDEDWFIFAETEERAAELHEEYEGYNSGDASAQLVCYVPIDVNVFEGWPEKEELLELGAEFLRSETPRRVKVGDSVYTEGGLDAIIELSLGTKH
jgi:hypothetical protein